MTFDPRQGIDRAFLKSLMVRALAAREGVLTDMTNACRVVSSEADGMPGLVIDKYAEWIVVQILSAGMDVLRDVIIDLCREVYAPRGVYERSDDESRALEGLGVRAGVAWGEAPPADGVEIRENGARLVVDVVAGHKTGFYLDQRENRGMVAEYARGRRLLNCFCYTGGFSVMAALGGARSVTSVDASDPALAIARRHFAMNGLPEDGPFEFTRADVFEHLRKLDVAGERFGMIILDPPKFASRASHVDKAARGYKDLSRLAFKLLEPGGYLMTYSCSGHISADLFQKIVFSASVEAGVEASIVRRLGQSSDHPIRLTFPESEYLKGLVCRVV